jgi:hypothetical protein
VTQSMKRTRMRSMFNMIDVRRRRVVEYEAHQLAVRRACGRYSDTGKYRNRIAAASSLVLVRLNVGFRLCAKALTPDRGGSLSLITQIREGLQRGIPSKGGDKTALRTTCC